MTQGLCDVCAITESQVAQALKYLVNESGKVTKVLSLSGSSIAQIIEDINVWVMNLIELRKLKRLLEKQIKAYRI